MQMSTLLGIHMECKCREESSPFWASHLGSASCFLYTLGVSYWPKRYNPVSDLWIYNKGGPRYAHFIPTVLSFSFVSAKIAKHLFYWSIPMLLDCLRKYTHLHEYACVCRILRSSTCCMLRTGFKRSSQSSQILVRAIEIICT